MNDNDIKFLKNEFQSALSKVAKDPFCVGILQRKFSHSSRVLQNGIQIIEHDIPELLKNPRLFKLCKQALFFHDIGRFEETAKMYQNNTMHEWGGSICDHGMLGAKILATSTDYNNIEVVLAVRHHGHLIEDFYNDEEYQNLSPRQKSDAEIIIKVVRDADKLDLYHLQKQCKNLEEDVFFTNLSSEQKNAPLSVAVTNQFFEAQPINHRFIRSFSDRILGCISWQFDLNFDFTKQLYISKGYRQMLLDLLATYCFDKELLAKIIKFASSKV